MTTIPNTTPSSGSRIGWRWYHYYFLLAIFDLAVILTSLLIYHRTLNSYEFSLQRLGKIHARQRWVASLRLAVIQLNAPGNDIFASSDVDYERKRFQDAAFKLNALLLRADDFDVDLTELENDLREMTQWEEKIFAILDSDNKPVDPDESSEKLKRATIAMAAMDQHQAAALTNLIEWDQYFFMRVDGLLTDYGLLLLARGRIERYLIVTVVVILVGVFWYGRKLQGVHDQMADDRHQIMLARHERLAAVGELCTGVAHGIRNPLAAISTSAQLGISTGKVDARTKERLEDILAECDRLDHRITRLLDFAADPAQSSDVFELKSVVEQALNELRPQIEKHEIKISTSFPNRPLTVRGDRDRMVQAVIELLANATAQTSPAGDKTTISIRCRHPDGDLSKTTLDICDNGPGIPEHNRPHIFDLFFTTKPGGTGIGLAAVKHTVQAHGGEVSTSDNAENAGQGACFHIDLPLI